MSNLLVVQIGNSDDKLSQRQWSAFVKDAAEIINSYQRETYFAGSSNPISPYQNYCWVFELNQVLPGSPFEDNLHELFVELKSLAATFNQDSIAVSVVDNTLFIGEDYESNRRPA